LKVRVKSEEKKEDRSARNPSSTSVFFFSLFNLNLNFRLSLFR
jgi:hypothetical protein